MTKEEELKKTCKFCNQSFPSRSALFRHIRTDRVCSQQSAIIDGNQLDKTTLTIALLVGYDIDPPSSDGSESEKVSERIRRLFPQVSLDGAHFSIMIQSVTQATEARGRQKLHAQEHPCGSTGDVLVITFTSQMQFHKKDIPLIIKNMNDMLADEELGKTQGYESPRILAASLLNPDPKTRLHAERHCTQRVYHYLLPLSWVISPHDRDEVYRWWMENKLTHNNSDRSHQFGPKGYVTDHRPKTKSPDSFRVLKDVLRSTESHTLTPTTENEVHKSFRGRFGSLGNKQRKCFHNFTDPKLQGDASPNHETVWRSFDRARVVHFFPDELVAVVEFRGDGFLREQIRRVVGSVVAICNGWLPMEFIDKAAKPDVIVETPIAPEGRLYFANARYHFEEQSNHGKVLFDDMDGAQSHWMNVLQTKLLQRRLNAENVEKEKNWIHDLEYVIAPRIQAQFDLLQNQEQVRSGRQPLEPLGSNTATSPVVNKTNDNASTTVSNTILSKGEDASPPPPPYEKTLNLLRQIVTNNQWPTTSTARQRVLHNSSRGNAGGSFTVLNPFFLEDFKDSISIPNANILFPELATSCFELEQELSSKKRASTHCAINCNAEFIPHVDSGRGKGQSLSMIVGLGDYDGGRIAVEGMYHDIRYRPLEFNGWKQRHWTEVFVGERFSLVWFTPDI